MHSRDPISLLRSKAPWDGEGQGTLGRRRPGERTYEPNLRGKQMPSPRPWKMIGYLAREQLREEPWDGEGQEVSPIHSRDPISLLSLAHKKMPTPLGPP